MAKAEKIVDRTGQTVPAVDLVAKEKLVTARVSLLLKAPFFGNLATRLKLVNADAWCQTAATDGRSFYYNSVFINTLKLQEVAFLFGHEVLHCVYDHMARRGSRHPKIFNYANDYCVNADLVTHKIGELITTVPVLYDRKYDGMASEEIYDLLLQEAKKRASSSGSKGKKGAGGGSGKGKGEPDDGEGEGGGSLDDMLDDLLDKMLDEHIDGDSGKNGKDSKDGKGGAGPDKLTDAERQQIKDEFKEAIINAAASSGAGNLPGGVQRLLKELTESKMDWRDLLRMQLESTIKSDFSWMRNSRRSWHMDAVMPGMLNDEMIDIAVAIDTSGSIPDSMLRDFLSEIKGIMETFPAYKLHVFAFDTAVHNPKQYDSDNLESIEDYQIGGRGGTMFECMFDYMKDADIAPKRLVVFTDGYPCATWGDENFCDTVWIIHGNDTIVPPWGQHAYYEE